MKRRTRNVWLLAVAILFAVIVVVIARPSGPRTMRRFEPNRLADLELRMWQAYYDKQNVRLFGLLVTMLREQYGYSWLTATNEGFHLARAAATFGNARSNYEVVLPDLQAAYTIAKDWLGERYDPAAVARSELAWWVARRIPGQNSPAQIGGLIADEYALLYGMPREAMLKSATLRAEAGALRDSQAAQPDWTTIARLLKESYAELSSSLNAQSSFNW
jgi:hypothetical protein